MHGHSLRRTTASIPAPFEARARRTRRATGAVTWIDSRRALIARTTTGGRSIVREVRRASAEPADLAPYLAHIVDEIGDRERVEILGTDAMRVALEREYVVISHRPDRIVDVAGQAETDEGGLVARLTDLTNN